MHIAVTGATGLIGAALAPSLEAAGHRVTRLSRGTAGETEPCWDPEGGVSDAVLRGIDALVHLAGENIAAGRWTKARKRRIRHSRVRGTQVLCQALSRAPSPPGILITASAIGYYGSRGDQILTEESAPGEGFLAEVVRDWEEAARPASDAGVRVVSLRLAMVLSGRGGALAKMLTPFQFGLGGRLGGGEQYWSWISIDDAVGVIHHALGTESLAGPVNAVAPHPVTNRQFSATLARVLARPAVVPVPAWAARLALGELADQLLLASVRVAPNRLRETGYEFRHPSLETALRSLLGK